MLGDLYNGFDTFKRGKISQCLTPAQGLPHQFLTQGRQRLEACGGAEETRLIKVSSRVIEVGLPTDFGEVI